MKVYVVPDENETRFKLFKRKLDTKWRETKRWASDNKEMLTLVVPVVIGVAATIVKVAGRHHNLAKQEAVKNLYCYDRSLGHYWSLRRELTNNEWLEIDRRKKNGERLSDILKELNVLR